MQPICPKLVVVFRTAMLTFSILPSMNKGELVASGCLNARCHQCRRKVLKRRFGLAAMEHLQHRKVKDELA